MRTLPKLSPHWRKVEIGGAVSHVWSREGCECWHATVPDGVLSTTLSVRNGVPTIVVCHTRAGMDGCRPRLPSFAEIQSAIHAARGRDTTETWVVDVLSLDASSTHVCVERVDSDAVAR